MLDPPTYLQECQLVLKSLCVSHMSYSLNDKLITLRLFHHGGMPDLSLLEVMSNTDMRLFP
jgi:hypothetical protein